MRNRNRTRYTRSCGCVFYCQFIVARNIWMSPVFKKIVKSSLWWGKGGTPPHAETFLLWREGAVTTPLYRSWWGEGEFGGLFPQASIGVRGVKKGTLPAAEFFIGGKMEGHSKPSFIRWSSSTFIYRGEVGWAALFLTFSNHLFFVFFNLAKFKSVLHFESSRGPVFIINGIVAREN